MPQDPIHALDDLISGLEVELGADPRFVLLQRLKTARADFGGSVAQTQKPKRDEDADRPTGRQMSPARQKALALAKEYLGTAPDVIKTKQIYGYIEMAGCELPGGANNLASLMGRFPKVFISHGRQGWSLDTRADEGDGGDDRNAPEDGDKESETAGDNLREPAPAASTSSPPDQWGTKGGPVDPWPGGGT